MNSPLFTPEDAQFLNDAAHALYESMQRTDAALAEMKAISDKALKKAKAAKARAAKKAKTK